MDGGTLLVGMSGTLARLVLAPAAFGYLLLSLVVGARLAVGRLAAERLEDESGLPEALDFDSRAWSAMEFVRHLSLVVAGACLVYGSLPWPGLWPALGTGVVLVVLGRILISLIAPRGPERILRWAVPLVGAMDLVIGPLLMPLARAHESLIASHRRSRAHEDEEAREEQLEEVIRDAEEEGLLELEQTRLMREIADVGDSVVREAMTPRTEIDAVEASANLASVVQAFIDSRHSRLPVYEGSLDHVLGVVSVRDLVRFFPRGEADRKEAETRARDLMRPVVPVPGSKKVLELLREFQRDRQQIAIIVDEYGGTAGLVTIEDLLEEIVGEIKDEYEPPGEEVELDGKGGLLAEGLMSIDDLEELTGKEIPEEGVETVGGLVFARLGRIPRPGDRVTAAGLEFEVAGMDGRRIASVRVKEVADGGEAGPEEKSG